MRETERHKAGEAGDSLAVHVQKLTILANTGLHMLPNLKILRISYCESIRSLPRDGLPSSLQELEIQQCPAMKSLPKEALPSSLQELKISSCPAILQSLHKEALPSSLRELDVSNHEWKDRMRFSRLKGTIPILRT